MAAIEHHIEELAAIGVPRPTSVPLYYRIADNQLTQADTVQAVGGDSSGEVETFVFAVDGEMYVSIASDPPTASWKPMAWRCPSRSASSRWRAPRGRWPTWPATGTSW